jgi:hypothetical protein
MGTRSSIAILNKDGTVKSIYAHWGGYISENGLILFQHYQDVNKVKELINLGSLSSLQPEINPPKGAQHSFDRPYEGVTNFYVRDRGQEETLSRSCSSFEEYLKKGNFQEYDYVFSEAENKWFLLNTGNGKLDDLLTVILDSEDVSSDLKIEIKNGKLNTELQEGLAINKGQEEVFKV